MFRFLHLADVHFDTPFLGRSKDLRELLRTAQKDAFEQAVNCALDNRLDCVLIGGDLLDSDSLSFATERFLAGQLNRLREANIDCIYVTGNHDPGERYFRLKKVEWPQNFQILWQPNPKSIEVRNSDGKAVGRVVGAGHSSRFVEENLASRFPSATSGVPNVGLLHTFVTSAQSADQHIRYAPCTVGDLEGKGYAYWALGHIHMRQKVDDRVDAWYPGVLQGRNFKESGEKGGLVVTIPEVGSPDVEFRSFSPLRWEKIQLGGIDQLCELRGLRHRAEQSLEALSSSSDRSRKDWLVRFELSGPSPLTPMLRDEVESDALAHDLESELGVRYVEISTQFLVPSVDVSRFEGETHILGEILQLIEEVKNDGALLDSVAPEKLAGFVDDGIQPRSDYLRELIKGLEEEVVYRFVGDNNED